MKPINNFIGNDSAPPQTGQWLEVFEPATGAAYASLARSGPDDVAAAVEAASSAFGAWSITESEQRAALLNRIADLIEARAAEFVAVESRDTGKPMRLAANVDIPRAVANFRFFASAAIQFASESHAMGSHVVNYTLRQPLGPVACISPWNLPLYLFSWKIAPALAAGNTVVGKPSEITPASAYFFARLVIEAGFPPGVLNIIHGSGPGAGASLVTDDRIKAVSFTGGTRTGAWIAEALAPSFKKVSLELGGKSPILVFDDADLESAVNGIIAGNFGATGQSCVAGSRVFIQSSIREKILEKLVERAGLIRIGDPLAEDTQVGPLCTKEQLDHISESVDDAVGEGAKLLFGGKRPEGFDSGWYYSPTILDCPHQDIRTVREEMFGPVLSALSFDTEEEAIEMANNSDFGLGSGVFTSNVARAIRVSDAIRSGIVWVNTYRVISPIAPFGGFKNSGPGREAGIDTIYDYTRTKTVWINTSSEPMANPFVMR